MSLNLNIKKILVFDSILDGHHYEYLQYIMNIQEDDIQFVFVVPRTIVDKPNFAACTSRWVFDYLDEEIDYHINPIKLSLKLSVLVRQYTIKHKADYVFSIALMSLLPFLPFILCRTKVKVIGIIYLIYPYRWKSAPFMTRVQDVFKYLLLSRFSVFHKILLLNDKFAPIYLNKRLYKTNKFQYIPDPHLALTDVEAVKPINLNIPKDKKIFLHLGAMQESKGTLEILKAVLSMDNKSRNRYYFIFAGRVFPEISEEFYNLINKIDSDSIYVLDTFIPFQNMKWLCINTDYFLLPYQRDCQSSGCIAYAAEFRKPVIVSKKGFLGKLVKRFKLGILMKDSSASTIRETVESIPIDYNYTPSNYLANLTVESFQNTIITSIY